MRLYIWHERGVKVEKISKEEQKKICLEILKYFDDFCKKNDIKYFLGYGTALGAVRHKGFIPWDDDIDVILLYNDYERLIDLLSKEDKYNLVEGRINSDSYYFFAKLCDKNTKMIEYNLKEIPNLGVCIDIFPLYNLADTKEESIKHIKKIKKIFKLWRRQTCAENYYCGESIIRRIIKKVLFFPEHLFYNEKKCRNKIIKLLHKYDNNCKYVGHNAWVSDIFEVSERNLFDEAISIEFENDSYPIVCNYDKYLENIYGDYMTPPPVENRTYPHNSESYKK